MTTGIYRRTEEHRKNMSISAKKRGIVSLNTPEVHAKVGLRLRDRKFSGETLKKMSDAHKGQHSSFNTEFKKGHIPWIKGKKGIFTGEKSPIWIKDRSLIKLGDRNIHDPLYKQWHRNVKNRDGWKCKISNSSCSGRLEAHHILNWKDYPELRYEINNGITLCHAHHPRKRDEVTKLSPYFQKLVAEMN